MFLNSPERTLEISFRVTHGESSFMIYASRGAVKGGKVRTILRAHDGRGPPEGENVISTEGNARSPAFQPDPDRASIGPIFTS